MSLHALATGILVADPVQRPGAKGDYTTATLRVPTDDGGMLVSTIAFGEAGGRLSECHAGKAITVSGRARLTEWTGRDGQRRHGVSVVADQIVTIRPRSARPRRRTPYPAPRHPAGDGAAPPSPLNNPGARCRR